MTEKKQDHHKASKLNASSLYSKSGGTRKLRLEPPLLRMLTYACIAEELQDERMLQTCITHVQKISKGEDTSDWFSRHFSLFAVIRGKTLDEARVYHLYRGEHAPSHKSPYVRLVRVAKGKDALESMGVKCWYDESLIPLEFSSFTHYHYSDYLERNVGVKLDDENDENNGSYTGRSHHVSWFHSEQKTYLVAKSKGDKNTAIYYAFRDYFSDLSSAVPEVKYEAWKYCSHDFLLPSKQELSSAGSSKPYSSNTRENSFGALIFHVIYQGVLADPVYQEALEALRSLPQDERLLVIFKLIVCSRDVHELRQAAELLKEEQLPEHSHWSELTKKLVRMESSDADWLSLIPSLSVPAKARAFDLCVRDLGDGYWFESERTKLVRAIEVLHSLDEEDLPVWKTSAAPDHAELSGSWKAVYCAYQAHRVRSTTNQRGFILLNLDTSTRAAFINAYLYSGLNNPREKADLLCDISELAKEKPELNAFLFSEAKKIFNTKAAPDSEEEGDLIDYQDYILPALTHLPANQKKTIANLAVRKAGFDAEHVKETLFLE